MLPIPGIQLVFPMYPTPFEELAPASMMQQGEMKLLQKVPVVKFNRFYVEKANGKLRPIGSPATPDKVKLSMKA